MSGLPLVDAGILLALLVAAAFFSVSETALIGVARHQVRSRAGAGDARARLIDRMLEEPERVLSTVLVGNNLANVGATAYATFVALGLFGAEGALIATAAMAVLITVATEILPKTFAVQHPLRVALAVARPLRLVEGVLKPVVMALTALSRAVARLGGARSPSKAPFITQDEIRMLVSEGVREGEVEQFEQKVIHELFDFTETDLRTVMTPRAAVHYLPRTAPLRDAADMAYREGRTRILVVDGDLDQVMGCVHVKDLLRLNARGLADAPVTRCLRPVLFARDTAQADDLLVQMQKAHRLMAVVQDEHGRTLGIATIEDLLEELVGEIPDEPGSPMGHGAGGAAA